MDVKMKSAVAIISIALVLCVATLVAASSRTQNTPLYTYRMEQASSEMNFYPIERNLFIYTTEKGYKFGYSFSGRVCGYIRPFGETGEPETCDPLCEDTSQSTCWDTCGTCDYTCSATCDGPTCEGTCDEPTCGNTCTTCVNKSCELRCEETWWSTCDFTICSTCHTVCCTSC